MTTTPPAWCDAQDPLDPMTTYVRWFDVGESDGIHVWKTLNDDGTVYEQGLSMHFDPGRSLELDEVRRAVVAIQDAVELFDSLGGAVRVV